MRRLLADLAWWPLDAAITLWHALHPGREHPRQETRP